MFELPDFKTCEEVVRSLDDYLKRELSPEEARHIDEHLQLCEDCVRHYKFEESLLKTIRQQAGQPAAPARLRQRVLQLLD